jgi:uncharacterized protein (DUF433 family)
MEPESWINIDPKVMGGKPCIRNTRITVDTIVGMIECGMAIRDLLANYPDLSEEDLQQAAKYDLSIADQKKIGRGHEDTY